MSILISGRRHLHVPAAPHIGSARIGAYFHLPEILSERGIDVRAVLRDANVRADIFADPDNLIPYPDVGRLLAVSAGYTNCDHIGLLIGQRSRLENLGLAGQVALCKSTAGEGLQAFANFFSLQNTAATISVVSSDDGFTRLMYAVAEPAMSETGQIQLAAMAVGFNILQDLCGPQWLPSAVSIASSAPSDLRPCQKFFRAPLQFDDEKTALIFESPWLGCPLPIVDPLTRRQVEAEVQARQAELLSDFPRTIRHILRKQLLMGKFSMDSVAAMLDMHRRTLDRRLKQHGMNYGQVLESVKQEVACQLLRDTHLPIYQVAQALGYTTAGSFSTAFHRWTGIAPSTYRRLSPDLPKEVAAPAAKKLRS